MVQCGPTVVEMDSKVLWKFAAFKAGAQSLPRSPPPPTTISPPPPPQPPSLHHQLEPFIQGRTDAVMMFTPNFDRSSECCPWNGDSLHQETLIWSSVVQFGGVFSNCGVIMLLWAYRRGTVWPPSAVPICFKVPPAVCSQLVLFILWLEPVVSWVPVASPSSEPVCSVSSDLSHQQDIFIHTAASQWYFSYGTILCQSWRCLWVKIPVHQQVLNDSYQPVQHQQSCLQA